MELLQTITEQRWLTSPAEKLRPFISFYYENGNDDDDSSRILLPHVGFSLIFNLDSDAFAVKSHTGDFIVEKHILLPRNRTYFFPSSSHFFCIHFLFSFLPFTTGKSQVDFKQPLNLCSLVDDELIENIHQSASFQQRIGFCNEYFSKLFGKYQRKIDKVNFVIEKTQCILNREHNYAAEDESIYVASKTLARNFLRYTGASYKDCFRVLRLRAFLHSYLENNRTSRPTYFGFYDYSHFYKEVINVTGYTFAELKKFISDEADILL